MLWIGPAKAHKARLDAALSGPLCFLSVQQDERNTLAAEVERLRGQLQGRPSPGRGGRDDEIGHDWRTEEIDRLRSEVGHALLACSCQRVAATLTLQVIG